MSDDKEKLLGELISYQKELKLLIEEEEKLSMESSSSSLLEEKGKEREVLMSKISSHARALIDLGISFGGRKIDPRKLKD